MDNVSQETATVDSEFGPHRKLSPASKILMISCSKPIRMIYATVMGSLGTIEVRCSSTNEEY